MDYKKKYKAALDWMRDVYPTLEGAAKEDAEHYFPELKESEDELARKEMLEYCYKRMNNEFPSITIHQIKRWLAWLEKQGKKAKYHDICDKCVRQPTCQSDCFLQQSEQMPIDKVEPKFKIGQIIKKEGFNTGFTIASIINGFYYNDEGDYFPFTDQDNWELVEQKPAWSEEDEMFFDELESYITYDEGFSEEQKEWRINKLKSLRPQKQWKPSDEQIIAIDTAINVLGKGTLNGKQLIELYQDLKKLKGEEI